MPVEEPRTHPTNTLAHLFPGGFAEFWQRMGMKASLEQIIYHYIPAALGKEEIKKTLASGGYGWGAIALVGHFTERYWFSRFEPWPDEYLAKFKSNLIFIISDVRRKEHLWSQVFRELEKFLKPLKLKTDTRTSQNYDKTQTQGGRTVNIGNESYNRTEQQQTTAKNIPTFSNVDMADAGYGGFSRQQQLSTQSTQQGQSQGSSNRKNTTDKVNHINKETYRSKADANVTVTNQDAYEWASVARILNNFTLTSIDFTQYYKLFDKLMQKLFAPTVVEIIDDTGHRQWVPQHEYQPPEEETNTGKPIISLGNEWDEALLYLERLQIYHAKNEKEYAKLPDTSNRKPRIALRLKAGEGCLKAYGSELNLPTATEFLARINGERPGFSKVIGYQQVIQAVVDYLENWEFAKEFGTEPSEQLMIGLLGDPGLGKSYISQAIGQALGVGFHRISLNGKKDASIVYGTNMENPGAEIGEIVKAISRTQSCGCAIFFDEIEKAGKEAKDSLGDPTDRTGNKAFRDTFFDFPTPLNRVIYFCALNYAEELPDFINDRFRMVTVEPPTYWQRLDILRVNLRSKIKDLDPAFKRIYGKGWEEIYSRFDQEALLKKCLTRTMSIRGAKDNILLSLIPTLISDFLKPKRPLPNDLVNYDWKLMAKEELDKGDARRGRPPCPYASDFTKPHREGCKCFVANLDRVPGWEENMEGGNQGGNVPPANPPPPPPPQPQAQPKPQPSKPPQPPAQPKPKPQPAKPAPNHPLQSDPAKLVQWKNISSNFTEPLIQRWEQRGFNWVQTKTWIDIGLTSQDAYFCAWIRDNVEATAEEILNGADLTELKEQYQSWINNQT